MAPRWRWWPCRAREALADRLELELPLDEKMRAKRPNNYVKTAKYTPANFVIKCGLEQFRNLSNVYFLVVSVLALLGTGTQLFDSPYSAAGTLLGLGLVIGFTMAFEGYYDVKRHREDTEVNRRTAYRLRPGDGHLEEIKWSEVCPGDLLKVHDRAQFPADLLFVTSCAIGHKCYVETANIDGETNLKIKHVPKELVDRTMLPDQAAQLRAQLMYDMPSALLTFSGSMRAYDDKYTRERSKEGYIDVPLDTSNILLRGSVLRNTPWVLGIVLYAGVETKVVQSSSNPPSKMSRLQKLINKIIVLILLVDLVMCTVSSLVEIYGFPSNTRLYYLKQVSENTFKFPPYVANVCTFIVLYSSLLPISLLFCMTFSNFWQAMFVHWDLNMYHEETDTPAKCNTMQLVQELGQVSYLFSDKTGTLTRNEMKLVGCTVAGETYGIGKEGCTVTADGTMREIFADLVSRIRAEPDSAEEARRRATLLDFLTVLAVCHTVLVDTTQDVLQYNAEGPDEEALVSAAAEIGMRLVGTDNGTHSVVLELEDYEDEVAETSAEAPEQQAGSSKAEADAEDVDDGSSDGSGGGEADEAGRAAAQTFRGIRSDYEILAVNQFNSTRKRMSVVCRGPDGKLILLAKGADTVMFELLKQSDDPETISTLSALVRHLDAFANDGLRTLVMAKRELSDQDFNSWKKTFDAASNALGEERAELLALAAAEIERDLEIVGASAIEDRLQDGVPETLVALREAGVKTWVLTGDKVETAINIAFSARLCTPDMELAQITSSDDAENLQALRELHDLLAPKNLAENSEKRRKGREAERERSAKNILQTGAQSTMSSLTRAVTGVTLGAVGTMEKAGRATLDTAEKAGRNTYQTLGKAGRAAYNAVRLKTPTFRASSPTSQGIASDRASRDGSGTELGESQAGGEPRSAAASEEFSTVDLTSPVTISDDAVTLTSPLSPENEGDLGAVALGADTASATRPGLPGSKSPQGSEEERQGGSGKASRKARPSSFGKFISFTRRDSSNSKAESKEELVSGKDGDWRRVVGPLPPGIEGEEHRVNEREVIGTEKNLDGFEAQNLALVISGPALRGLLATELGTPETQAMLLSIARLCTVVVACRVSPKQKALLVRMVKEGVRMDDGSSPITLAIGDGANDVAMIQEARVGVGISGHEGRQAVNSSDFAIAQFRFLQQLMLVHGRWNYRRAASMVLFVFYANILFVFTAFVFNFFNKFSGSALFWVFLTTVYSYPTQIPIAVAACLNKDISRKTALEYPAMYVSGRQNLHLNKASSLEYIFRSFVHGFLISAVTIVWATPRDINISAMGTTVYMACIWVCVARSCLETYTWTWLNVSVTLFGFFAMFIFEPIYYATDPAIFVRFGPSVLWGTAGEPQFLWPAISLVMVMCTSYDMVLAYFRKEFSPSLVDIVIEIDRGFGDDTANKKSRLRKINRVFRKIAQPLTIPKSAISELFAAANLTSTRRGQRSAFDFDHPEDERLRSLVQSLLNHASPRFQQAVSIKIADTPTGQGHMSPVSASSVSLLRRAGDCGAAPSMVPSHATIELVEAPPARDAAMTEESIMETEWEDEGEDEGAEIEAGGKADKAAVAPV